MWCRRRRRPPVSPWKDWESPRIRWKPLRPNTSGASARPDSSSIRGREPIFLSSPAIKRGNPYAVNSRVGTVAADFCNNKDLWLWLPAFAGDDVEKSLLPHRQRDQAERADDHAPPRE